MNMSSTDHLILILLSMLVAFGPRFIPLRIFSTREIPKWFNEWMKYVPVSRSMGLSVVLGLVAVALLAMAFPI